MSKKPRGAGAKPRKEIFCKLGSTHEETAQNFAKIVTSPELAATRTINAAEAISDFGGHIDIPALMDTLRLQAEVVNSGDLKQIEGMLVNQATALQGLFARLTEKAMDSEYMTNIEGYMRLALRAQSQCRAALKTLSEIKNPPTVYAQQANIAQGHQQVNNMACCPLVDENVQNQLLGEIDGERMDRRTTKAAIRTDQDMEAVGKVHGAED